MLTLNTDKPMSREYLELQYQTLEIEQTFNIILQSSQPSVSVNIEQYEGNGIYYCSWLVTGPSSLYLAPHLTVRGLTIEL